MRYLDDYDARAIKRGKLGVDVGVVTRSAVDDKSIRVRWLTVIFNAVASLGSIDYVVTVSGITALHADAESYTTLAPASPVRF